MKKLSHQRKLLIAKILIFVFAFVLAVMPSSASRNLEVNSRVIVEMLGIDSIDEGLELTAQYAMPLAEDGATSKSKVTVRGRTITEAVDELHSALGRRVELGHCSIIVVGENFDPHILGTLVTASDITANVYLGAAEKKASDLIGQITDFMKKTGATDADFIAYSAKKSHVATTTLLNFLSELGSASQSAFMPLVEILDESGASKPQGGEGQGGGSSGGGDQSGSGQGGQNGGQSGGSSGGGQDGGGQDGGSSGGDSPNQTGAVSSGMALKKLALYGNEGRRGIIDEFGMRGVAWISSPVEKSVVVTELEYNGEYYDSVSARLLNKDSDVTVDIDNNSATVRLRVSLEPNCSTFNRLMIESGGAAREAIKQAYARSIEKELRTAFEQSKAYDCDPFFLKRDLYRFAPDKYDGGYDLNDLEVEYKIRIDIQ